MITKKDLEIENISYTNKDFAQIYPELLDIVKKVTNKWDPETTDESDPGLVLLKLAAFIGDKNNYNIDKNILEQFMVSATQETSMRRLTEMLGYNMKYYNSATTKISFNYKGGVQTLDDILAASGRIKFEAFDTSFKTEDGIVYTLLESIELDKDNKIATDKLAIEGQLKCLNVLTSTINETEANKINLYNLDEYNRIYFPDVEVAENGIFIDKLYYNGTNGDTAWRKVNNLNDQDLGQKIFKFGYDSDKAYPYIEFPSDIANLIGNGLEIWYIVSDGEAGYAKNNSLTELNSWRVTDIDGNDITLGSMDSNSYVLSNTTSIGSKNPETLTEAYNNFKKTVGTFDTLVSCRDYANAIYNHIDENNQYLVSSIQVGDVRTDINNSHPVLIRDNYSNSLIKTIYDPTKINGNILLLHGTKPYSGLINTVAKYNSTYFILSQEDLPTIENSIYENKTIYHELKLPETTDINYIKNKYTLKVNISTKYKVNQLEQTSIINNIKKALYNNFNARFIDFGEEIPYDSLVNVMMNSDSRIKNIILDDPEVNAYIIHGNGNETLFNAETGEGKTFIVNNILAGRIPYYQIDPSFSFDYNIKNTQKIENITLIQTNLPIAAGVGVELHDNESVQVLVDSYNPTITYPAYVYYNFSSETSSSTDIIAPKDTVYKLKTGEKLRIYYTDSDGVAQFKTYQENEFIRPNFDLKYTVGKNGGAGQNTVAARAANAEFNNLVPVDTAASIPLFALGTKEQVEIVKRNETILKEAKQKCFWYVKPKFSSAKQDHLDHSGNLVFDANGIYILEEGEFFVYPSEDMTSIVILSSGTKLEYHGSAIISKSYNDYIDISELENALESEDIGTFENSFKWETKNFSNNNLTIVETNAINFVKESDDTYEIQSDEELSSEWKTLTSGSVIHEVNGDLSITASEANNARARALLSINCSSLNPQTINAGTVKVFLNNTSLPPYTFGSGTIIQLSPSVDSYKDIPLNVDILTDSDEDGILEVEHTYPYKLFKYTKVSQPSSSNKNIYGLIESAGLTCGVINSRNEYAIPLTSVATYMNGTTSLATGITLNNLKIAYFDTNTNKSVVVDASQDIDLSDILTDVQANQYLYITVPLNLQVADILQYITQTDIENAVNTYSGGEYTFDFLAELNYSKLIDSYNVLGALGFFDHNNLYNRYTLGCIDFETSEFNIVGSSKK
jgi:hypothetical protein